MFLHYIILKMVYRLLVFMASISFFLSYSAAFFVYNMVMHCWYSSAFDAFDAFLYPPTYHEGIPLLHCVAFRGSLHFAMLLLTLHLLDRQVGGNARRLGETAV